MSIFEAISIVISSIALAVLLWQMIELRRQLQRNYHLEFVKRYTDIIRVIPPGAFEEENFSLEDCIRDKPDFKITARLYFWLIQEEYGLHKKRLLPSKQWSIWEKEFSNTMKRGCFLAAWKELEKTVAYPNDFVTFVNDILTREEVLSSVVD